MISLRLEASLWLIRFGRSGIAQHRLLGLHADFVIHVHADAFACCGKAHFEVSFFAFLVGSSGTSHCILDCVENARSKEERWLAHRLATMDSKWIVDVFQE